MVMTGFQLIFNFSFYLHGMVTENKWQRFLKLDILEQFIVEI